MERAPATVAMIISNDICGAHGEIIQLKFTQLAGNYAEGNTITVVPASNLCTFSRSLSLFQLNANAQENPKGSYIHRISVRYHQRKMQGSECLPWEIFFLPNITDCF